MPIKFRCQHCRQFLGISRQRAGALTDCPTCGRQIRVPDLNGDLEALPEEAPAPPAAAEAAPRMAEFEIDLLDIEKASAETVGVEPAAAPAPKPPASAAAPPVLPEPKVASEIPSRPAHVPPREPPRKPEAIVPPQEVFAQLGKGIDSSMPLIRPRRKSAMFSPPVLFFACLACFVLGLILGWTLGRNNGSAAARPANPPAAMQPPAANGKAAPQAGPQEARPPAAPPAPPPPPAGEFSLTGSVRYEGMSGESLPDEGARILAIPLPRRGGKLPSAGFRVGAGAGDVGPLQVAAGAAGGMFARADGSGNLSLKLPAAGKYAVLVASRFQTRQGDASVSNSVREFLDEAFDRPGQVLGSVQFDYREVTVAAGVPEELRIYFAKP